MCNAADEMEAEARRRDALGHMRAILPLGCTRAILTGAVKGSFRHQPYFVAVMHDSSCHYWGACRCEPAFFVCVGASRFQIGVDGSITEAVS